MTLLASCDGGHPPWVSTWTSSMMQARRVFADETVRQVARVSVGGDVVRVRLSNTIGTSPVNVGAATVGLSMGGAAVQPGSLRELTFEGERSVRLTPGEELRSDPVALSIPDGGTLVVSLYIEAGSGEAAQHLSANQTTYVVSGDQVDALDFDAPTTDTSVYWLSGVEVQRQAALAIVAFGDSITEGAGSTLDGHDRYPDALADELAARGIAAAVVNAGIGGNRILNDAPRVFPGGPSGLSRFERDALSQTGATHLMLLEGVNDLGIGTLFGPVVSAEDIIGAYRQVIAQAHARGLDVLVGTILPFRGATIPEYWSAENEAKRQAVNAWIRTTDEHDGFVDFDAVMRDPADPEQMPAALHSGDFLHPSSAGYQRMAEAAADVFEGLL
ncbi:MAG: SGNH/GDSL hydrolase family protein [Polyangiales bacterium]|nr:SGNH/GDSL hydrolase family protein [Myxococcales bacterium]